MPEDLKLSQIDSSQLLPPFRGLHSPAVRKHCQIIFACYFRKSSVSGGQKLPRAGGVPSVVLTMADGLFGLYGSECADELLIGTRSPPPPPPLRTPLTPFPVPNTPCGFCKGKAPWEKMRAFNGPLRVRPTSELFWKSDIFMPFFWQRGHSAWDFQVLQKSFRWTESALELLRSMILQMQLRRHSWLEKSIVTCVDFTKQNTCLFLH